MWSSNLGVFHPPRLLLFTTALPYFIISQDHQDLISCPSPTPPQSLEWMQRVCLGSLDVGKGWPALGAFLPGDQPQPEGAAPSLPAPAPTIALKQCHKHTLGSRKDTRASSVTSSEPALWAPVISGCSPSGPPSSSFPHQACPRVSRHLFQLRQLPAFRISEFLFRHSLAKGSEASWGSDAENSQVRHRTREQKNKMIYSKQMNKQAHTSNLRVFQTGTIHQDSKEPQRGRAGQKDGLSHLSHPKPRTEGSTGVGTARLWKRGWRLIPLGGPRLSTFPQASFTQPGNSMSKEQFAVTFSPTMIIKTLQAWLQTALPPSLIPADTCLLCWPLLPTSNPPLPFPGPPCEAQAASLTPDPSTHLWHLNGELCALGLCILEPRVSVLPSKKNVILGERSLNLTYTCPESARDWGWQHSAAGPICYFPREYFVW